MEREVFCLYKLNQSTILLRVVSLRKNNGFLGKILAKILSQILAKILSQILGPILSPILGPILGPVHGSSSCFVLYRAMVTNTSRFNYFTHRAGCNDYYLKRTSRNSTFRTKALRQELVANMNMSRVI